MTAAFSKDDAFLADVDSPASSPDELRVWWLGQSGFLVRWGGRRLLLDPYLSDSLTTKYAGTDKPHVRMTERVIAPERLQDKVDLISSSHNHTDHLDLETIAPHLEAIVPPELVIPEANRSFVCERLGILEQWPIGLEDGLGAAMPEMDGVSFHGIAAAHNAIDRDDAGRCKYLGYVVRCGRWTIYHSGDTLIYPGLVEKLRAFAPIDVALLPINGNKPERRVAGNLDGREAAQLAHDVGARWVVPCHYEMFEFNTADPQELFIPACERLAQPYRVLRAGEEMAFN
jgi:L-ascorbate metabolism protein UlaG (beta-lactamase superfamily)